MASDVDVMRVLIVSGADPLLTMNANTTPLMVAAGITRVAALDVPLPPESSALEAVKLCLELGGDVNALNAVGETALHGAAYRGADTIVQFLVDKGAKVNAKNKRRWTPLTIAEGIFPGGSVHRFPSTIEVLRKLGADPSPPDVDRSFLSPIAEP